MTVCKSRIDHSSQSSGLGLVFWAPTDLSGFQELLLQFPYVGWGEHFGLASIIFFNDIWYRFRKPQFLASALHFPLAFGRILLFWPWPSLNTWDKGWVDHLSCREVFLFHAVSLSWLIWDFSCLQLPLVLHFHSISILSFNPPLD